MKNGLEILKQVDKDMKKSEERSEKIREILGVLAGKASMCWSQTPKGIFDSTQAEEAVNQAFKEIEDEDKRHSKGC